jgi:hypothetical protein
MSFHTSSFFHYQSTFLPQTVRPALHTNEAETQPPPEVQPQVGFVEISSETSQESSQLLRSVSTELEVQKGETEVVKFLRDISGANKHQEALQNFFGDSREVLVKVEEVTLFGGWKDDSPEGLALTIQYEFSSTELLLTQESQIIHLNDLPTGVVVEYVGKKKLQLTLSVVQ